MNWKPSRFSLSFFSLLSFWLPSNNSSLYGALSPKNRHPGHEKITYRTCGGGSTDKEENEVLSNAINSFHLVGEASLKERP